MKTIKMALAITACVACFSVNAAAPAGSTTMTTTATTTTTMSPMWMCTMQNGKNPPTTFTGTGATRAKAAANAMKQCAKTGNTVFARNCKVVSCKKQ